MYPVTSAFALARPLAVLPGVLAPVCALARQAARQFYQSRNLSTNAAADPKLKSLYVADCTAVGQTSPTILGLVKYFERHLPRVGFFVPVPGHVNPVSKSKLDDHVDLIHASSMCHMDDINDMQGMTQLEAAELISTGRHSEFLDKLFEMYAKYREKKDFVVVEGCGDIIGGTELDARIAAAFNTPVLLHLTGEPGKSAADYYNLAMIKRDIFMQSKVDVVGVIMNRIAKNDHAMLTSSLHDKFAKAGLPFAGALPEDRVLASNRLADIQTNFNTELLYGTCASYERVYDKVIIGSQRLDELLAVLTQSPSQHPLVVTTADRLDLVFGLVAASLSKNAPSMAGVVLTQSGAHANLQHVSDSAVRMLQGVEAEKYQGVCLPILGVNQPLYEFTTAISRMKTGIVATSERKILQCRSLFEKYINLNDIAQEIAKKTNLDYVTPMMFQHKGFSMCKAVPQHIVLPEGYEPRIIAAAAEVTHSGMAKVTLLGDPTKIQAEATKLGVDITGCNIVNPATSPDFDKYVDALAEVRNKKKEMPRSVYEDMVRSDVNMFGTLMVALDEADGMVSGAIHTTAATIKPALMVMKSPDCKLVSSVFFMCLPDKVLVYGDCAVNPNPTSEELAQIAISSADTAAAFGIPPRVAMLSYSTLGSGAGPDVKKVTDAVAIVKERRPDIPVEGPIQYDAAIDPTVAKVKVKTPSEVAGKASVFIFPDLNTGNNTYKAVQQATGAVAMGPVMQGLGKPVNDLSRGCTVQDVINTIAATSVQAMAVKRVKAGGRVLCEI